MFEDLLWAHYVSILVLGIVLIPHAYSQKFFSLKMMGLRYVCGKMLKSQKIVQKPTANSFQLLVWQLMFAVLADSM